MFLPLQSMGLSTRLSDYIKYWDRVLSSRSVEKTATASLEPRQVPGLKNVYLFISYKVSNKNLSTRISFLVFSAFLVAIGRNGRWAYKKNGAGALSLSRNCFQSGILAGGVKRGVIIIIVNYLWGAPKQWFQGAP